MLFLDLFSGIGGFRLALEKAGHKCLGHCEIDKYANIAYNAMHNPREDEWFAEDIQRVKSEELPRADLWCFGFPCQDISVAGKQRGLEGARSGLFFTVINLIKSTKEEDKPSMLIIENVKNLLSINGGWDFARVLIGLDEVGYDAEWALLNSKDYGVPQNRERVFIVGHLRGRCGRKIFPIRRSNKETLKQLVGGSQGMRVYDSKGLSVCLSANGGGMGAKTGLYLVGNINPSGRGMNGQVYDSEGLSPTLTTNKGEGPKVLVRAVLTPERINKRQNGRRIKNDGEPMFTLTAQDRHGVLIKEATKKGYMAAHEGDSINLAVPGSETRRGRVGKSKANTLDTSCNQGTLIKGRIRKLTPLECFRLQGFPDEYFYRAKNVGLSDTSLYKCAGNAVTINPVYEISKRLN